MPAVALDASAVYLSPSGRRCRWQPLGGKHRDYTVQAHFVYLDSPARLGDADGFTLLACHYRLLRAVEHRRAHAATW